MCWVMPPASPATTLAERMRSSSSVLPWSTWPMTVMTGGRQLLRVRVVVVVVVEEGLELQLLLLAGLDEEHVGAELEGEQLDLLVGQRHGGRDHLAVLEQEAHDVGRRAVQLGAELLGRGAPLDDDRALGHGRVRWASTTSSAAAAAPPGCDDAADLPCGAARRCERCAGHRRRDATGTTAAGTATRARHRDGRGRRDRDRRGRHHRDRRRPPGRAGATGPGRDRARRTTGAGPTGASGAGRTARAGRGRAPGGGGIGLPDERQRAGRAAAGSACPTATAGRAGRRRPGRRAGRCRGGPARRAGRAARRPEPGGPPAAPGAGRPGGGRDRAACRGAADAVLPVRAAGAVGAAAPLVVLEPVRLLRMTRCSAGAALGAAPRAPARSRRGSRGRGAAAAAGAAAVGGGRQRATAEPARPRGGATGAGGRGGLDGRQRRDRRRPASTSATGSATGAGGLDRRARLGHDRLGRPPTGAATARARPRRGAGGGGRLLGRALDRLGLLGLLTSRTQAVALGLAADAVGLGLLDARRVALHADPERDARGREPPCS